MCATDVGVPEKVHILLAANVFRGNDIFPSPSPSLLGLVRIAFGFPDALFSWQMITAEAVTAYIRQMFPDATVTVIDKTGTQDHLIVRVTSDGFLDKNLLDRHRMVYQALAAPMKDGRIHAVEITAKTQDEAKK